MGRHDSHKDRDIGFDQLLLLLQSQGTQSLTTFRKATPFVASERTSSKGSHVGEPCVMAVSPGGAAPIYRCCWEHSTNCSGTRIGQYCEALDDWACSVRSPAESGSHDGQDNDVVATDDSRTISPIGNPDAVLRSLPKHAEQWIHQRIAEHQRLLAVMPVVVSADIRTWVFETGKLDPDSILPIAVAEVAQWSSVGQVVIYLLQVIHGGDVEAIREAFADAKKHDRVERRAYPRMNEGSAAGSRCLYVGSSADIGKRLREHLGYGARQTYALQLAHWARDLRLEVEFVCVKYEGTEDKEVLQALEDTLWDELQPLFGRRGRR